MKIEDLKNYERYWRANRSIEQRIMRMKAAEVSTTPQAGDGSQHQGARDPMMAVDRRVDWCKEHSIEYRQNLEFMQRVDGEIREISDPLAREAVKLFYTDFRFGRRMTRKDVSFILYGKNTKEETVKYLLEMGRKQLHAVTPRRSPSASFYSPEK